MRTRGCLRFAHRTLVAKGFAALIVVLVIMPFTAPFSTVDVAELLSEGGHSTAASAAKLADDDATGGVATADLLVVVLQPFVAPAPTAQSIHLQPLRTIVLRL